MEETKEIQGLYKIFRAAVYVSLLLEFFEYAVDPETLDHWNRVLVDIHDRIKTWFIYHDGNLIYAKVTTFLLICITCVGTRNKKHLEMDAQKQVLYPLLGGVGLVILSVFRSSRRTGFSKTASTSRTRASSRPPKRWRTSIR